MWIQWDALYNWCKMYVFKLSDSFFICNWNLNLLGIFFANGVRIAGHHMCKGPLSHVSGKEYELTSWKKDAAPKLA